MSDKSCSIALQTHLHDNGVRTMQISTHGTKCQIKHKVPIPSSCCPVSKNPAPGSTLSIVYTPKKRVLEVYGIQKYLASFIGGHPSGERNMEGMITMIAHDFSLSLETEVSVFAHVILSDNIGELEITSVATP